MAGLDRDAVIRTLKSLSSEKLADILRKRDRTQWREEVFEVVEQLLAERARGQRVIVAQPTAVEPPTRPSARASSVGRAPEPAAAPAPLPPPSAEALVSPLAFEEARSNSIAVYCSDGRLAPHVDTFVSQSLTIPRCDRLVVPGGPVFLSGRLEAYWEGSGVDNQMRFLIEAHALRRVVLIGHEGCAYYTHKLGLVPPVLESEQILDLHKAAVWLRQLGAGIEVQLFFARVRGEQVLLEPVTP
jgi:hypothetical protein